MCGIVALWDPALQREERTRTAHALAETLRHRGPDGSGTWCATASPLALAHQRLNIRGGASGAQPMVAPDGASALIFSGEIFATDAIRGEFEASGARFHGESDTEVLLQALVHWGLPRALAHIHGQFAFVWYSAAERALYFARDRVGIRPLYYAQSGERLVIGSEQKAVLPLAWVNRQPRYEALLRFVALNRTDDVPFETMLSGVQSLPAGYWARWDGRVLRIDRYSRVEDSPSRATVRDVRRELERAVGEQLVSDRPVGALVSGGLDSSAVALLADRSRLVAAASEPMHLFAYHDEIAEQDERTYQRAVIDGFHSPKIVHWVSSRPRDLAVAFQRYIHHQEEPYGDISSYAEYCIAAEAAKVGVRVLLSGLGGDEVFAGYPAYFGPILLDLLQHGDLSAAKTLVQAAGAVTHGTFSSFDVGLAAAYHTLPASSRNAVMAARSSRDARLPPRLVARLALDAVRSWHPHDGRGRTNAVLRGSIESWAIPRLLMHSDRACLASGVESRVPLLDDGVIRAAFGIACDERVSTFGLKAALRAAVSDVLPPIVLHRAWKLGFHVPLQAYVAALDEPLRVGHAEACQALDAHPPWERLSVGARWRWGTLGCYLRWVKEREPLTPRSLSSTGPTPDAQDPAYGSGLRGIHV